MLRLLRTALPRVAAPRGAVPLVVGAVRHAATEPKVYRQRLLDGNEEILTEVRGVSCFNWKVQSPAGMASQKAVFLASDFLK